MSDAPLPIRPASTVMLVRDGADGIEVFMLRRTIAAAFAGGAYVFPGGKVDAADGEIESDAAYRVAAIREVYEEAGVLLARDADGRTVDDGHPALAHRDQVYDGSLDVRALCARHGLELAVDQLAYVSRWITPKGETTRRFDTRFFIAEAPAGQSSHHDDNETIASFWVRPEDALARQAAGELMMLPPTIVNLRLLADAGTAAEAMRVGQAIGTPPTILPKLKVDADGRFVGVSMPGDADYDALD